MDEASREPFAPLLAVTKPLLGLLFAAAIEGSRVVIVGSVLKGQLAKQDRPPEAAAVKERAERLKQVKATSGWAQLAARAAGGAVDGLRRAPGGPSSSQ